MSFNSLKNSNDDVIKALKETEKLANLLKAKKDTEDMELILVLKFNQQTGLYENKPLKG